MSFSPLLLAREPYFWPALCSIAGSIVPYVAPPSRIDGATAYARGIDPSRLAIAHMISAFFLTIDAVLTLIGSSTFYEILLSVGLIGSAAAVAVGRKVGSPVSDAIWAWILLSGLIQMYAASLTLTSLRTIAAIFVSCPATIGAAFLFSFVWIPRPSTTAGSTVASSPLDSSNLFSRITFSWMSSLIKKGGKGPLSPSDVPNAAVSESAETADMALATAWSTEVKLLASSSSGSKTAPNFTRVLFVGFSPTLIAMIFFKLSFDATQAAGPLLLAALIDWITIASSASASASSSSGSGGNEAVLNDGIALVVLIGLTSLVATTLLHQYFSRAYRLGLQLRAAVTLAVGDKALRAGGAGCGALDAAIVAVAADAKRVQDLSTYVSTVFSAPFQIGLYTSLLAREVGVAAAAGIFVMILALPLNYFLAAASQRVQKRVMAATDARVAAASEAINAIRLIKTHAWEAPVKAHLTALRKTELREQFTYRALHATGELMWQGLPVLIALATFSSVVLTGGFLSPRIVFTSLALLQLLRFPLAMLPSIVSSIVEAHVSLKRIQKFLDLPEVPLDAVKKIETVGDGGGSSCSVFNISASGVVHHHPTDNEGLISVVNPVVDDERIDINIATLPITAAAAAAATDISQTTAVSFRGACFSFSPTNTTKPEHTEGVETGFQLGPLDFDIPIGSLVAVVGPSGGGKSALLCSLLGELWRHGGSALVRGPTAYAPQTPFILNATVKENILFGSPFNQTRYQNILESCALIHDLTFLSTGDETELGEKGINLSGGQKARIGLARALYSTCPLLLLDDPLSAVDAHVGATLAKSIATDTTRTRFLVTHALHMLESADYILVISEGKIVQRGTPTELLLVLNGEEEGGSGGGGGGVLAHLIRDYRAAASEVEFANGVAGGGVKTCREKVKDDNVATTQSRIVGVPVVATTTPIPSTHLTTPNTSALSRALAALESGRQITIETRAQGAVATNVWSIYIAALGGRSIAIGLLILFALVYALSLASTFWIAWWAGGSAHLPPGVGLGGYVGLSLISLVFLCFEVAAVVTSGIRAGASLHDALTNRLLSLPLSFFDTTPTGRILNRVAGDVTTLDGPLPEALASLAGTSFNVVTSLFVAVIATPFFIIILTPIAYFYYTLQKAYISTSRELQRLTSVASSPILSHLTEVATGRPVFRSFGGIPAIAAARRARFLAAAHLRFATAATAANRWLAVRSEIAAAFLAAGAAGAAVFAAPSGGPDFPSRAGLAISTLLGITQSLNWAVRMRADVENALVSVERIAEYASLTPEADVEGKSEAIIPPSSWPQQGSLTLSNLRLRYRVGTPEALRGINAIIPAGARVGVVGRTGAGKTSLAAALFRTADDVQGDIILDGISTARVPLTRLRSSLALVSQDAPVFAGPVRRSLDYWKEHTDVELRGALDAAGLTSIALSFIVETGGSNLSGGERQQLALARALLRHSRLVILDEATASVDATADAAIRIAVKNAFKDATVITIAHRLATVLDSDLIIVLDCGVVKEMGSPASLLADTKSEFAGLVRESAKSTSTSGEGNGREAPSPPPFSNTSS